jgi:hypothetical protein
MADYQEVMDLVCLLLRGLLWELLMVYGQTYCQTY